MDRAADLWTLVSNLKNAAYDEPVHILQMLGDKLINDCRIEVFGVTIEPLWVEAYCYDETHFPDYNTHRSRKQKNRFGQMYFHERGYGGVDICLSNSEDFCLSFLLKATLTNGHFLTQTQLLRVLLSTGKTKADFEHLEDILHPANARHTICHTTRVNLTKPCYSDAPLTSFALDAIPKYDFRFARKNLRENVRAYLLAYMPHIRTVPNKNAGKSAAVCSDGCPTWCGHGCTTDAQLVIAPAAAGTARPECRGRSVRTQCSQPG